MALFGVDLRTTQHHQHHHEVGSLLHDPVIRQLQAQLSEQQQQISQLQTRYDTLVKEAADEAQARRASAAEVVLLKAQLNEFKRLYCSEGSGANVGTISATSNAAPSSSVPFMPSTAGTWSEVGVAGPFNGTLSVNASSNTGLSLSQPPSCPASLDRYAAEIPVDEREAMRTRMLRDRGPHHTPLPLQQQPADTSLPQVEEASRAPSPEADTSRLSLLHDGNSPNEAATSQLSQGEKKETVDDDGEETESDDDFADRHMETDDDASDAGWRGEQSSLDEDDGVKANGKFEMVEDPRSVCPRTSAANGMTNGGFSPIKTEIGAVPCTTLAAPTALSATNDGPACAGSAVNDRRTADAAGTPSPLGEMTTTPTPSNEAASTLASADVSRQTPNVTGFSHQLFCPSPTQTNSMDSTTSGARVGKTDAVNEREAPYVTKWEESESSGSESKPVQRNRYQHCTFCSSCEAFRTDLQAVAKCEACPRILCRECAGRKGENVPRTRNAEDVVFPAKKCLCQSNDSEFPKPRKGKDPKAHLLKHLRRHDLSRMFREPVDVEENPDYTSVVPREKRMDLGMVRTRMVQHKEYQSSRGQKRFRADIKKIWTNCWAYAGYSEHSTGEVAGIVRCTIILEAMTQKFYTSYMKDQELVGDKESWQVESDRRKEEEFARCARPNVFSGEAVPFAAVEFEDEFEEETDVEDENSRLSATVGRKRKYIKDDTDDDDLSDADTIAEPATRSSDDGLNHNMCALAAIGERFHSSSSKKT